MFTQLHSVYQEHQMASYNKVKAVLLLLNTLHENFQEINDANIFWQRNQTLEYLNLLFVLWGMWGRLCNITQMVAELCCIYKGDWTESQGAGVLISGLL